MHKFLYLFTKLKNSWSNLSLTEYLKYNALGCLLTSVDFPLLA